MPKVRALARSITRRNPITQQSTKRDHPCGVEDEPLLLRRPIERRDVNQVRVYGRNFLQFRPHLPPVDAHLIPRRLRA
ncbi:MAG: hypothetical protein VYB58_05860, partial [Verrucomicrobiota bacterium]|nr:hypothetical protein [Verrucomicrobiota bacterium]